MIKNSFIAATLALGLATSASAATLSIDVDGASPISAGTLQGAGSAVDFYDYANGTTNSGINRDLATAYAFIFESTTTGDFSLGMVFTGGNVPDTEMRSCRTFKGDPDNPCRTHFAMDISGLADTSIVSVKDDGANIFGDTDRSAPAANGYYDLMPFKGTTDGFIVDGLGSDFDFTIDVETATRFDNITFVSGTADNFLFTELGGDAGEITFTRNQSQPSLSSFVTPVPVPASVGLLAGGLMLLGGAGAMRRRKS